VYQLLKGDGLVLFRVIKFSVVFVAGLAMSAGPVTAGIVTNGGFEEGDFTGWETIGITSIQTDTFGTGPAGGTYQALMQTAGDGFGTASVASLELFLGISAGSLASISTGDPISGSAIFQEIQGQAGDILSFSWNFLSSEEGRNNDFAFWALADQQSADQKVELLADTTSFDPDAFGSPTFFTEETGFYTTSYVLTSSGTFTLGFGVMDVNDVSVASGLLIDNVSVSRDSSAIPEPSSLVVFALAGLVIAGGRLRRRRE
jgi:hypothetical protein